MVSATPDRGDIPYSKTCVRDGRELRQRFAALCSSASRLGQKRSLPCAVTLVRPGRQSPSEEIS